MAAWGVPQRRVGRLLTDVAVHTYTHRFFPSLAAVLSKRIGPKRVAAYRGGDSGYKMFNLGTFLKTLVGGKAKAQ